MFHLLANALWNQNMASRTSVYRQNETHLPFITFLSLSLQNKKNFPVESENRVGFGEAGLVYFDKSLLSYAN